MFNKTATQPVALSGGNVRSLYSGDARFESRPGFYVTFPSLVQGNVDLVLTAS
jgi:hypothetical protein